VQLFTEYDNTHFPLKCFYSTLRNETSQNVHTCAKLHRLLAKHAIKNERINNKVTRISNTRRPEQLSCVKHWLKLSTMKDFDLSI